MNALTQVIDPELGVDIVNLGLIYNLDVYPETGKVLVEMTLTAPGCPLGDMITAAADKVIRDLEGVQDVSVTLVWQPPWEPTRMTSAGRARLGMPG